MLSRMGTASNPADESDVSDEEEEDDDRRRALIWFELVFVLFLIGGANALGIISFGGTGELTVNVTDQNGQPLAGETVEVLAECRR